MGFSDINRALTKAYEKCTDRIDLDSKTRIAIFSDLHRGVSDGADDFFHNRLIFGYALYHYYENGFTYVELGDGDELYENRKLADIVQAHGDIFGALNAFHNENRFYYVLGNHNIQMGKPRWLRKAVEGARTHFPELFLNLRVYKTLKLGERIFLVHGHQGDLINDFLAPFGRFWVRYVWRPLQAVAGFKDPARPAENEKKRNKLEEAILSWARAKRVVVIAGHTHRSMFSALSKQDRKLGQKNEEPNYFNCGSGVHPRCVTGLEIQDMTIELVKWHIVADPRGEGCLKVARQPIKDCRRGLNDIFAEIDRLASGQAQG
jgi:UDP-2,3-diacylglucosamine pyrophosphatase LpxH